MIAGSRSPTSRARHRRPAAGTRSSRTTPSGSIRPIMTRAAAPVPSGASTTSSTRWRTGASHPATAVLRCRTTSACPGPTTSVAGSGRRGGSPAGRRTSSRRASVRAPCGRPGAAPGATTRPRVSRSPAWTSASAAGKTDATRDADHAEARGSGRSEPDTRCLVIEQVCTDECSPVPHVYRNPLLLELLNCCDVDLPRVDRVSWTGWTGPAGGVTWDEFSARIQVVDESRRRGRPRDLVHPSGPGRHPDHGVGPPHRPHPGEAGRLLDGGPRADRGAPLGLVGDLARGVQLVPDSDWLAAEVTGRRSSLTGGFRLEITLRGQLLRDDCGHMLDAVPDRPRLRAAASGAPATT